MSASVCLYELPRVSTERQVYIARFSPFVAYLSGVLCVECPSGCVLASLFLHWPTGCEGIIFNVASFTAGVNGSFFAAAAFMRRQFYFCNHVTGVIKRP